jgi:hypothetical protein
MQKKKKTCKEEKKTEWKTKTRKEWDEQSNAKRKHNPPCNLWSATESY